MADRISKHDDHEYTVTSKVEGEDEPMVQQVFGPVSKKKVEEHIKMAHEANNQIEGAPIITTGKIERVTPRSPATEKEEAAPKAQTAKVTDEPEEKPGE